MQTRNRAGPFQLHEVYSRLCAQRQVSGAGQGECLSLCSLLESRGIFGLKKAKEARLTKVGGCGGRWGRVKGQRRAIKRRFLLELLSVFLLRSDGVSAPQVFLKIEEKEVENALKDRALLGAILAAGLPS